MRTTGGMNTRSSKKRKSPEDVAATSTRMKRDVLENFLVRTTSSKGMFINLPLFSKRVSPTNSPRLLNLVSYESVIIPQRTSHLQVVAVSPKGLSTDGTVQR